MNSSSISAGVVAPHPARLSLIYAAVFTILWTWLIYALPALPESGVPALGVRLISYGLLALGLWLGLERTSLTPKQRQASWLSIMIPFTLWATAAWTAAIDGAFRAGASSLPLLPAAMLLPVIVGAPVLLMSKRIGQLLDAMPATWLIALQLYRIFGSQWLAYWLGGSLPGSGHCRQEQAMCSRAFSPYPRRLPSQAERRRDGARRSFGMSSALRISPSRSPWG
ncbi:hypothetical protein ACVWZ4_003389 [Bradyrhizobium sp. USDA 4472]